jgi:hypothetical protein
VLILAIQSQSAQAERVDFPEPLALMEVIVFSQQSLLPAVDEVHNVIQPMQQLVDPVAAVQALAQVSREHLALYFKVLQEVIHLLAQWVPVAVEQVKQVLMQLLLAEPVALASPLLLPVLL